MQLLASEKTYLEFPLDQLTHVLPDLDVLGDLLTQQTLPRIRQTAPKSCYDRQSSSNPLPRFFKGSSTSFQHAHAAAMAGQLLQHIFYL